MLKEKNKKINKESTNAMIKIEEKNKKMPKEISQGILKKILKNLIVAIFIMVYFITLNILYTNLQENMLLDIVKICATVLLVTGIVIIEIAYKKDNGTLAITGIELLVLSMHSLFINHVTKVLNYDFRLYLLTSSYVFAIYYVLKTIIIYTKSRRKYLLSFSDVSDIVKKDEPTVKEAKKRNITDDDNEIEDITESKVIESKKNAKNKEKTSKKEANNIKKDKKELKKDKLEKEETNPKNQKEPKTKRKTTTKKAEKDVKIKAKEKAEQIEEIQENKIAKKTKKTTDKEDKEEINKTSTKSKGTKNKSKASKKEIEETEKVIKKDENKKQEESKNEEKNQVQKPKSKRGRKPKKEVEEND